MVRLIMSAPLQATRRISFAVLGAVAADRAFEFDRLFDPDQIDRKTKRIVHFSAWNEDVQPVN
jgi:hypothetical protein